MGDHGVSLKVHVIKARNVVIDDKRGGGDAGISAFLKLYFGSANRTTRSVDVKTKAGKALSEPDWEAEYFLHCKETKDKKSPPVLEVQLFDRKKIGASSFPILATGRVQTSDLVKGEEKVVWVALEPAGEVQVGLHAVNFGVKKAEPGPVAVPAESVACAKPGPGAGHAKLAAKSASPDFSSAPKLALPKQRQEKSSENSNDLAQWTKILEKIAPPAAGKSGEDKWGISFNQIKPLRRVLAGQTDSGLKSFSESGALKHLLDFLKLLEKHDKKTDVEYQMQFEVIRCLKAYMDNRVGMNVVINTKNAVRKIALSVGKMVDGSGFQDEIRTMALQLLLVISAWPPNGHKLVLDAMSNYCVEHKEEKRFQTIVETARDSPSMEAKVLCVSFINLMIQSPGELSERMSLRKEFILLGITDIIAEFETYSFEESPELDFQVNAFKEGEANDTAEYDESSDHTDSDEEYEDKIWDECEDKILGKKGKETKGKRAKTGRPGRKDRGESSLLRHSPGITPLQLSPVTTRSRHQREPSSLPHRRESSPHHRANPESKTADTEHKKKITPGLTREKKLERDLTVLLKEKQEKDAAYQEKLRAIEELTKEREELRVTLEDTKREYEKKLEFQTISSSSQFTLAEQTKLQEMRAAFEEKETEAKKEHEKRIEDAKKETKNEFEKKTEEIKSEWEKKLEEANKEWEQKLNAAIGEASKETRREGSVASGLAMAPEPPSLAPLGDAPEAPSGGPPPPAGGPTGPPPPPGMQGKGPPPLSGMGKLGAKAAPAKSNVPIPGVKMKKLQWTRMPDRKVGNTVFSKMNTDNVKVDFGELENMFAAKVVEKKEKKPGPVSFLDPKKSQSMSIFLSKFKNKSFDELADGIASLDESMYNAMHVDQLLKMMPSSDDLQNIKEFLESQAGKDPKDRQEMANPEKFAEKLSEIPQLDLRLAAFKFKYEFSTKKDEFLTDMDNFRKACKEIKDNVHLQKIMEMILLLGNFLNGGTNKGNATGFDVSTLTKLGDTKSTDNKSSLMNYLVKLVQTNYADGVGFAKDMPHLEAGAKINMNAITGEVGTLKKDFVTVQKSSESIKKKSEADKFQAVMKEFIPKTTDEIDILNNTLTNMENDYKDLTSSFGEDPKTEPSDFLGYFVKFATAFEAAQKENETAKMAAEKAAKREAALKQKAEEDEKKKKAKEEKAAAGGPSAEEAVVDELLSTITSGSVFQNRARRVAANRAAAI